MPPRPSTNADPVSMRLLKELTSLNFRFIELLCKSKDVHAQLGMPAILQDRLISLSMEDQRRLSTCPYSLFDLKLSDEALWTSLAGSAPAQSAQTDFATSQFALGAMIYAQMLATENADLGKLLLGMSKKVAQIIDSMSIGRLMDRAVESNRLLKVRLINDPNFWPDLVNYVQDGTQDQYLAAQTSALQLIAARRGVWPNSK